MRYIVRRQEPEKFADIQSFIPNLNEQLGAAGENCRRFIRVPFSSMRYAQYVFFTKKGAAGWTWVSPSLELVAENEKGLFELTRKFNLEKPAHLAHLPG